ncbi:MAG TPA: oxidoreductase [Prolixibacteraceae bacterium]|nr:oxidoreductase [Prolixibacteraceae bacterium]HCU62404.1 oxidoreductase [Prolixibacteraceae bacterium]
MLKAVRSSVHPITQKNMFTNTEKITRPNNSTVHRTRHKVISVENLTPETFVVRIEKNDFRFEPGQYVVFRIPELKQGREYSIYSGANETYLDFLVREIPEGSFSRYLRHIKTGEIVELEGPKGFFILDEQAKQGAPLLFVATGTGISPFHSFVKSFPDLNYNVLHGVHFDDEAYGRKSFIQGNFTLCTSRVDKGDYFGRVTYFLKEHPVARDTICYLCGNSEMIEEVAGILENYGIPPENIRTEVFF